MPFGYRLDDKLGGLKLNDDDGDDVDDCLVIGIDFGTTYSGAAWATRADIVRGQINFITSWPDSGREEGKVPTEIWYDENDEPSWGHSVPADVEPFRWFKLLLLRTEDVDPDLQQSEFLARTTRMMEESGKTPVSLVADYLRLFWAHILSAIERARGESVVEALAIHVVITVPAIWKSYARRDMEEAAERAGILDVRMAGHTKLTFAPEPEAAAFSTLLEQGSGVRPGNVYVVCDAGGGTVDLISYEVKSTEPIILHEAVEGTGGLCGGIIVDQAFETMCKGRLGFKWKRLSKMGIREIMRNEWEHGIKPQFKPVKVRKEYIVSLPAEAFSHRTSEALNDTSREPHIKNGRIHFLGSNIEKVFAGVFAEIEKLVEGQIQKASNNGLSVTGIILVGGLGGSPYLYEHLKALYSKAAISVLQSGGMKPRTAICRGAVLKGFLKGRENQLDPGNAFVPVMVASTVSRASYGVRFWTNFDASIHLEKDKIWDIHKGIWRAANQMRWYLKRGEKVSGVRPVRFSWSELLEEKDFTGTHSVDLYECESEVSPTRWTSTVRKFGEISCNLTVKYSDLPDFKSKTGVVIKELKYEIELVPSGASVEFVIYVGGIKQEGKCTKIRFVE